MNMSAVNQALRVVTVSYDHPDAARLIEEVQQEHVLRYGGRDGTPVDPAEFAPPGGLFLVAYLNDVAIACGGWRSHAASETRAAGAGTTAEVKRMYVSEPARRTGIARALLAELERTALAAGFSQVVLETGSKQPEAVSLYRAAGYCDVPPFGYYADAPGAIHLGKRLATEPLYRRQASRWCRTARRPGWSGRPAGGPATDHDRAGCAIARRPKAEERGPPVRRHPR